MQTQTQWLACCDQLTLRRKHLFGVACFGGWAGVLCCAVYVWMQALLESPDAQAADTAGLQLAAALGFAVYGFKEWKKLSLGESLVEPRPLR